jgi:Protein of unknown function (DUF3592)
MLHTSWNQTRSILFLALAALTGWIEFNSVNWFVSDRAAAHWPSTQGIIQGQKACSPVHECGLQYAYQVNGKSHTGERISFTKAHLPKGWSDDQLKRWAENAFPVNKSVRVFYQPDHPENSALQAGILADSYLVIIAMMGVVTAGLLFLGLYGLQRGTAGQPE